jgi:S1-C subfamily serine protease
VKIKHLLAVLAVAVAALTGVACAGITGGRPGDGAGGQDTTATGTTVPTARPGGDHAARRPKPRPAAETLSQADLIAKVKPSVVRLVGSTGGGSGVVIDAAKGLVLTNAHVTFGMQGMRARAGDDPASETAAQLVAAAPCDDLAVVRLVNKPANLRAIRFGNSSALKPGDHVTALGYPGSLAEPDARDDSSQARQVVPTDGNVSVVDFATASSPSYPRLASTIVHQAFINPGNSGGPLVDDRGRLVGINTLSRVDTQGQFYSISANRVRQVLPGLLAGHGQANLGWDLTSLKEADLPSAFAEDPDLSQQGGAELGQRVVQNVEQQQIQGLYVRETERDSPVEEATIFHGNLVITIDDQPVRTMQDVCDLVLAKRPGTTLQVSGYFLYTADAADALHPWQVEVMIP